MMKNVQFPPHSPEQADPIERYVPLVFKLVVYAITIFILVEAATTFNEYVPLHPWPFLINMLHMWIILPIHEGGHFLFMFFGRTLHILGGSFWQIMFPLLWFVVALRQRSHVAPLALFCTGVSIMDVSLYMRDAHFMAMPLLGGDSRGHDWHNLLSDWGLLDSAESLGDFFYYTGLIVCIGAITAGIALAFISFFRPPFSVVAVGPGAAGESLEDSVDDMLERNENAGRK
jgi:hypothetical protein